MLQSVLPEQTGPEGKFNDFFKLANDETAWENKIQEYTNKLKEQMEEQTNNNNLLPDPESELSDDELDEN
jgi:hypothetical protein